MEAELVVIVVSRSNAIEIPMAKHVWGTMTQEDQDDFVRRYAAKHYGENLRWRIKDDNAKDAVEDAAH